MYIKIKNMSIWKDDYFYSGETILEKNMNVVKKCIKVKSFSGFIYDFYLN